MNKFLRQLSLLALLFCWPLMSQAARTFTDQIGRQVTVPDTVLSVHVSPARQGIVIGTAQALIAIADFISPVLGGFVLGYALYGVWIGIAISVAIIGLVTAMIYLSKSSVLIVKPETE